MQQEDYPFILYNNRSVEGVVQNFINWKEIDALKLIEIERRLDIIQSKYNQGKQIGIETNELNITCNDVTYSLSDLNKLTDKMNNAKLLDSDRKWLYNRGITDEKIKKYMLKSISEFKDRSELEILGLTVHPLLDKMLEDGIKEGGILIPLYKDNLLVNCTSRKISDIGKLKYTQSCPDVDVYGLETIEKGKEAWICEGLFDMMSLHEQNAPAVSVSGAMWSGIQIYKLLSREPGKIFIFADNDQTGFRCAKILQILFTSFGIETQTFCSKRAKDPAEHFLEKKLDWSDIKIIDITEEIILEKQDQTFNFTKYLKTRSF